MRGYILTPVMRCRNHIFLKPTVNLFSSPRPLAGRAQRGGGAGWGRGYALEHEVSSRVFPLPNPPPLRYRYAEDKNLQAGLPQVGEGTQ